MARQFAKKGHNLIIAARSEDKLLELKAELEAAHGVDVIAIAHDLSNPGAGQALYDLCRSYTLDFVINNAGFGDFSHAWDVDLDKAGRMLNLNVHALAELSLNFVRDYRDEAATLINVSSIGGYKIFPTAATYCATKYFVAALTEGMAIDLENEGKPMRAKVLAPAATATEFFNQAYVGAGMEADTTSDRSRYTPPEKLAEHAYALYESDKVLGFVESGSRLTLHDPMFATA